MGLDAGLNLRYRVSPGRLTPLSWSDSVELDSGDGDPFISAPSDVFESVVQTVSRCF